MVDEKGKREGRNEKRYRGVKNSLIWYTYNGEWVKPWLIVFCLFVLPMGLTLKCSLNEVPKVILENKKFNL